MNGLLINIQEGFDGFLSGFCHYRESPVPPGGHMSPVTLVTVLKPEPNTAAQADIITILLIKQEPFSY